VPGIPPLQSDDSNSTAASKFSLFDDSSFSDIDDAEDLAISREMMRNQSCSTTRAVKHMTDNLRDDVIFESSTPKGKHPLTAPLPHRDNNPNDFPKPTVANLDDAFAMADDSLNTLNNIHGPRMLINMLKTMESTDYSTGFSGIDSPGTAGMMLEASLKDKLMDICGPFWAGFHELNMLEPIMKHLHATEKNVPCRMELNDHPNPPRCLFADQVKFWKPEIQAELDKLKSEGYVVSLDSMMPLIHSRKAMQRFMICENHHGKCCYYRRAKVHFAGPPCTAWSSSGSNARENDWTMPAFAAWCGMRLVTEEPIIIFENSPLFPPELLARIFDATYIVISRKIDPSSFGWAGKRTRLWAIMLHREYIIQIYSGFDNVLSYLERELAPGADWRMFLVSGQAEQNAELEWLLSRKDSYARTVCAPHIPTVERMRKKSLRPFWDSLTNNERIYETAYEVKNGGPNSFVTNDLGQDGRTTFGVSSSTTHMYTIKHRVSCHWIDIQDEDRTWTPCELLTYQGFPLLPSLGNPRGTNTRCCSFSRKPGEAPVAVEPWMPPRRTRKHMAEQAGNSQCVPVNIAIWCYILAYVRRADQICLWGMINGPPRSIRSNDDGDNDDDDLMS